MSYQMDSIWLEDDQKLYLNDPTIQLINSATPILLSKNNIDLPPLPPSSYFQSALQSNQLKHDKKSSNGFMKMFKKLSLNTTTTTTNLNNNNNPSSSTTPNSKRKISTPFAFNHISHIDQESPITNTSFQMPTSNSFPDMNPINQDKPVFNNNNSGICFNTTSPQLNNIDNSPKKKSSNRSLPNSSSINSSLFQRTASISTLATTISGKSRKHSSFFNNINEEYKELPSSKKQMISSPSTSTTTTAHKHSNSQSSIENLKVFEKTQINNQCSTNYNKSISLEKPTTTSNKTLESWETPDRNNVVRQSWIYEDLSPFIPKISNSSPILNLNSKSSIENIKKFTKRSNSISYSPSYQYNSPILKQELNLFQNEMELSFNTDLNYGNFIDSIDKFKKLHKELTNDNTLSIATTSPKSFRSSLKSALNNNGNESINLPESPCSRRISSLASGSYDINNNNDKLMSLENSPLDNNNNTPFIEEFSFENDENVEYSDDDDMFNETIASLRAAKFTRMSRMDLGKRAAAIRRSSSISITTPELLNHQLVQESIEEIKTEEDILQKDEIENLDEDLDEGLYFSDLEEIPTQHKISVLLPSIIN